MYLKVNSNSSVKEYRGYSNELSATPPENISIDDTFYAMDTQKQFYWTGREWAEDKAITQKDLTKLTNTTLPQLIEEGFKKIDLSGLQKPTTEAPIHKVILKNNLKVKHTLNTAIGQVTFGDEDESIWTFPAFTTSQLNEADKNRMWLYGLQTIDVKDLVGQGAIFTLHLSQPDIVVDEHHYRMNVLYLTGTKTSWQKKIDLFGVVKYEPNGDTVIDLDALVMKYRDYIDAWNDELYLGVGFDYYIYAVNGVVTGYPATKISVKVDYTLKAERDEVARYNPENFYLKSEIDEMIAQITSTPNSSVIPIINSLSCIQDNKNGKYTSDIGLLEMTQENDVVRILFDHDLFTKNAAYPKADTTNTWVCYQKDSIREMLSIPDYQLQFRYKVDILNDDSAKGQKMLFQFFFHNQSNWANPVRPKYNCSCNIAEWNSFNIPLADVQDTLNNPNNCYVVLDLQPLHQRPTAKYEISFYLQAVKNPFLNSITQTLEPEIVCWGDSLTAGGGWTQQLAQLTGLQVYNGGTGGENAQTIMARQGGDVMMVNNLTIPADTTPVLIATYSGDHGIPTQLGTKVTPLLQGGTHVNPCMIGDVEGTLKWTGSKYNDTTGTWTFTRSKAGEVVEITRPTAIRTAFDMKHNGKNAIMIIYMGQNGGWNNDVNTLIEMHRKMIDHCEGKEYIILGLSSGSKTERANYEKAMKDAFGRRFISLREYLATPIYDADGNIVSCYGLDDQKLEPGEKDYNGKTYVALDEIKEGIVPHQILADGVHYTNETKIVIGNLIYRKMKELNIL